MKNAYFAGGCFWCIAAAFRELPGVFDVIEGYSGGSEKDANYREVKSQKTSHRETVCVVYDEGVLSYDDLLDFFFDHVDPFDPDGQFIDRGFSYTLAAFWQDPEEKESCEKKTALIERECGRKVCISLLPYTGFYPAEEEHIRYSLKNPEAFAEEYRASGREARFNKDQ